MSKLSFRARALDASKPMPIYLAEELPDLPDYSAINRAVPQMPSGMEKEEESEHHLQRAISGTGLIIPTPEVSQADLEFYERCYPPDYKMPKQHIHMQPLWEEQETPEYDIDSEDEQWLKQQRHPELTELKFEQMMDKLEKSSGQTVVTLSEAKLLLERQDDLVIAVYDYWLNKRLTTQHPLILSVRTESRPGQSANNPYLAFRRRTEKMQTRKNRKNDESSYEKMLKLRRELATALSLLEMVARREKVKKEMVKLTALLAEKRYVAKDFTNQLPEPVVRPQLTTVPLASMRREFAYPPRPPSTPTSMDTHHSRQREKRPYKRRKHRHHTPGSVQGVREGTSSEEECVSPIDDGPFSFRRKPGCYYEMPTSTLYGDPVESTTSASKQGLFEHEMDERTRFNLTSVRNPYPHYIGFARRRLGRGGRVILDRVKTELDSLWSKLPIPEKEKQEDLENQRLRTPKEITRDYHSGGKHPWRQAFRRHLTRNPHLWIDEHDESDAKMDIDDIKFDFKMDIDDVTMSDDFKLDVDSPSFGTTSMEGTEGVESDSAKVGTSVSDVNRTIDSEVRGNLKRVMRKRVWSSSTDYDSDDSLKPVEREFESFITDVQDKWIHFRPKTPSPSPPPTEKVTPLSREAPISVELSTGLDTFTTEFRLKDLYDVKELDGTDDIENFTGFTEAQVESILSETDLKALDDKRLSDDLFEELVKDVSKDSFLLQGQSVPGRTVSGPRRREPFGSTSVRVSSVSEPLHLPTPTPVQNHELPAPTTTPAPPTPHATKPQPQPAQEAVPTSKIIVEEVNEVNQPINVEKREIKEDIPTVQLKTVQKKHIITSRRPDVTIVTSDAHSQLVTVAVSDSLKVRLGNQATTSQGTVVGLLQNGPFAVTLPVHSRDIGATTTITSGSIPTVANMTNMTNLSMANMQSMANVSIPTISNPRRPAPLVQIAHKPLNPTVVVSPQQGKLKVLHAHPISNTQRAQLLAQNRQLLPTVVSLATIDSKPTLLKAPVTQFFEIKSGQLSKPHLVSLQGKRLDFDKKRQVVFDGTLKGNIRPRFSLDGRHIVRATLPVRNVRHQIQLKNRVVSTIRQPEPSTSVTNIPANIPVMKNVQMPKVTNVIPNKLDRPTGQMSNVIPKVDRPIGQMNNVIPKVDRPIGQMNNVIPKVDRPIGQMNNVMPKLDRQTGQINNIIAKGQKIAISGGQLSANVQAIAFTTAQLKARQGRLITQPRATTVAELEPTTSASTSNANVADTPSEGETNGSVRRRTTDNLPMEVT
ncbi:uncharacterized protein LOC110992668 isoform X2 [Pieris rapae]|uniref:uncharacterized protein LOC110992668 isoform X2 n=1 Tax=Pieris rapae TaxID=64459 RepID=UPI001E27C30B|nr:uncharacterized protein LOC110992668 isoform X2 [Pieris rapae]